MDDQYSIERGHFAYGPPWFVRVKRDGVEDLWPCLSKKDAEDAIPKIKEELELASEIQANWEHVRELWD